MLISFLFLAATLVSCCVSGSSVPAIELLNSKDSQWQFVSVSPDGYSLYRRPNKGANVIAAFDQNGELSGILAFYQGDGWTRLLGLPTGPVLVTPDVRPLVECRKATLAKKHHEYSVEQMRLPELGGARVGCVRYHGERIILFPGGDCFAYPEEENTEKNTKGRREFLAPSREDEARQLLRSPNEGLGRKSGMSSIHYSGKQYAEKNLANSEQQVPDSAPAPLPGKPSVKDVSHDEVRQLLRSPNERLSRKSGMSSIHYSGKRRDDSDILFVDCQLLLELEKLKDIDRQIKEMFSI